MPEAPQSLGGFNLIERIGKGGMGEVWRAERVAAGGVKKRAAIKRIVREFHNDATLRERFLAEARITARLEHPNIVQVIDFGDQPELYLVLEYIEGASVADLLRQASLGIGPLPPAAALYIVAEAASGLDYAHRKTDEHGAALNIVHRDISPPNILVSLDGAVKVGDFGIARAADNVIRTQAGIAVGKLVYMAPEQARGDALDHRADVFALGVVLWELLALRPLLPRNNPAAAMDFLARGEIPTLASVGRNLPPALDEIVREALAKDPARRTPSANKLARALRTAMHSMAPGFDSRELSAVVAGLLPDLAFGAPTPPPVATGSRSAPAAPLPAASPSPSPPQPHGPAHANPTVVTRGPAAATMVDTAPPFAHDAGRTSRPRIAPTREARYELPPGARAPSAGSPAAYGQSGAHPAQTSPAAYGAPHAPMAHPGYNTPGSYSAPSPAGAAAPGASGGKVLPWVLGGVVALAAIGGGALLMFGRGNSSAPPAATVTLAVQQTLTSSLARAARGCGDRYGATGIPGRASLEASYDESGAARALTVKIFTNDTARDAHIVACTEASLRTVNVPATREGLAVRDLAVSF